MKLDTMPLEPETRGKLMIDQRYLAFLVRKVKTVSQFNRILKSIENPVLRAEVRKMVTPMLTLGRQ